MKKPGLVLLLVFSGLIASGAQAEAGWYRCNVTARRVDNLNWVTLLAANYPIASNSAAIGWCQNEYNHEAEWYCEGKEDHNFLLKYTVYKYATPTSPGNYYIGNAMVEWVCRDGYPYYASDFYLSSRQTHQPVPTVLRTFLSMLAPASRS